MTSKGKKVLIGTIIIFGVVGYLTYSGMKDSMVYYLTVKEFLENQDKYKNEGVRISGVVLDGSIIRDESNALHITFEIIDEKQKQKQIKVDYTGLIPDTFKHGVTVVVEGKLSPDQQIFKATVLLAKCPSKYEEKKKK